MKTAELNYSTCDFSQTKAKLEKGGISVSGICVFIFVASRVSNSIVLFTLDQKLVSKSRLVIKF